ncbi:hypothetical protein ABLT98_04235 [Acinetobacter baumannii]|uniref:hypothetical protein n=1 Tax=Acinetobacter calcoaceticus/baumannii complex TaxID=909768 RepID=UPI00125039DA|nr:hypothetical protein [Acinetobacter seifertii]
MAEAETYGSRIEKKLDSVQQEVKLLSETVLRSTLMYEQHKSLSEDNAKKIERLDAAAQKSEGAITFLKFFGGFAITGILTFSTWIVSSHSTTQQRLAESNQKIAILESKLIRLDTDISLVNKSNFGAMKSETNQ